MSESGTFRTSCDARRESGIRTTADVGCSSAAFKAAFPAQAKYFHRIPKGGRSTVHTRFAAIPEAVLGSLLVAGSIMVFATNFYRLVEIDLFAAILVIQSLPFLSAVATEVLERFSEAGNDKPGLPC